MSLPNERALRFAQDHRIHRIRLTTAGSRPKSVYEDYTRQRDFAHIVNNVVTHRGLSPYEISRQFSWSRREFLRAAGLTLGSALSRSPFRAANIAKDKKVVVVTFGGGARDQETFAPEGQENIPNMMRELIPRAAFFT